MNSHAALYFGRACTETLCMLLNALFKTGKSVQIGLARSRLLERPSIPKVVMLVMIFPNKKACR